MMPWLLLPLLAEILDGSLNVVICIWHLLVQKSLSLCHLLVQEAQVFQEFRVSQDFLQTLEALSVLAILFLLVGHQDP